MPDRGRFPAWGDPGTPVLPAAVRESAVDPLLHGPLLAALGLNPYAGVGAVFAEPLREPVDAVLFGGALHTLLARGLGTAAVMGSAAELLAHLHPSDLEDLVPQIGWRTRTVNAAGRACLREGLSLHDLLSTWTFGALCDVRGVGVFTVVDMVAGVENALVQLVGAAGDEFTGALGLSRAGEGAAPTFQAAAWGEPGSPVLPAALVEWASVAPDETAELIRTLGFQRPVSEPLQAARLGAALKALVESGLGAQPALGSAAQHFGEADPASLTFAIGPLLRTRTWNAVRRNLGEAGLPAFLSTATVDDVLSIRQFGVVSFFDLLVAAETAGAATQAAPTGVSVAPQLLRAQPLQLPDSPAWAGSITADDPRFRPLLGHAASMSEMFEAAQPRDLMRLRSVVEDAEPILEALAGLTLEQEAQSVLAAALNSKAVKWLEALGERFGLTGRNPVTLDEVGKAIGVTRERVRQVQSAAEALLPEAPVHAPAVDQALELLDWALPCTGEDLAAALGAGGLTSLPSWTGAGFQAAVTVTGRTVDIGERDGLIGRAEQLQAAAVVTAAARAVSNAHGIASAATVTRRIARDNEEPVPQDTVESLLRADTALHWIDGAWFWTDHPPSRNRLVNTSLRILAVNSPQTLEDMLGGVERDFAFRASSNQKYADLAAPAPEQLAGFYAIHPMFRLLGQDRVEPAKPVDVEILGEEKRALVAVLRGQPHQAMDRLSLHAACDEIGMKRATVTVWTTYAECLKRFGHNVWGLRGADVSPEVIEELQAQARAARRAVDRTKLVGTTPSGRPWTARRITPSFVYSGVMAFDWGKPQLAYRTLAVIDTTDGEPAGSLRFEDNFNWGYSVFLGRHNAQPGQVLRVLADPEADTCYLELGGDELLDEPFDV
jgi:hypothetical protein